MKLTNTVFTIVLAIVFTISTSVVFAGELEAKGDRILGDCCNALTSCGVDMEGLSAKMTSEVKPIIDEAKACIKECRKKIAIAEIDKDEAVIADAKVCITKCENAIKGCKKVKTTAGSLGRRGKLLKELASDGPETFMNKIAAKTKKAVKKVRRKKGK